MNTRDKSFDDSLAHDMSDHRMAAAKLDAVMELEDPAALALHLSVQPG